MPQIGILIPTDDEAVGLDSAQNFVCGFGAGKAAACAMTAELIFKRGCDRILIWGTAGGLSQRAKNGTVFLGKYIAYGDYDVRPIYGSTGVGFVKDYTDANGWVTLDNPFSQSVRQVFPLVFPELRFFDDGKICSSDRFAMPKDRQDYNRIEAASDAVDMETAAVAEFIHHLTRKGSLQDVQLAVIRAVSNQACAHDENGNEFFDFLPYFNSLNARIPRMLAILNSPRELRIVQ